MVRVDGNLKIAITLEHRKSLQKSFYNPRVEGFQMPKEVVSRIRPNSHYSRNLMPQVLVAKRPGKVVSSFLSIFPGPSHRPHTSSVVLS